MSCAKGSTGFHNIVCLIIDIAAQNTESAETWHLTKAEAGRKANKGENKGRISAMIMQLTADPAHEYGSCGFDGCKGVCVWCMHSIWCVAALVCFCAPCKVIHKIRMSLHICCLTDMCTYYYVKMTGVKACMYLYGPVLCSSGAKNSIN